ncbi:uncharacterized protein SCHCODRAFT_02493014 [Schizophyllum commune H4-8]|uniref:Uncharacterized protein n=1 Tax=Schizophyllum commune (strain H4-8 / FGSC 9210) TaxID=578458 RepID=D8PYX2_SCHCM|nr:uncharacterized protein SCHCODRAFT_02493014 [Schizophyllum commune H4-8]KAI5896142.1 hypothetical protein SCHCODRAFT_02493014 [Schizophyllum commune H4-8]
MYNILHIARLLDAFAEQAIANTQPYKVGTSPANGGAGATAIRATTREWRCATFDRAAIRMSCNGYLLPRDGYGDRYMSEFWAEHQDLRYKQDISECGWPAFVARSHDGFAPLTKEEQISFDATSYAACLQWVARRPNDTSSALPDDLGNADDPHGIFRELHNLSNDPFHSNSSHRDGYLVGSRAGYPVWNPSNAGAVGQAITERLYASSPGIPREENSTAAGGVEKAGGSTPASASIGDSTKASASVPDGAPMQRPPEKHAAPLRIKFPPAALETGAASQQKSKDPSPRADVQREPQAPRSQLAPTTGANGNSDHTGPSRSQSNNNQLPSINRTVTANGHASLSLNGRPESHTQSASMPTNGHTPATNGSLAEPRVPSSQPTRRSESSTSQSSSSSTTHYPPRLKPREALQPRLPPTTEEPPAPRLASVQAQDPPTDTERNGQVDPPPSSPLQSPVIGPARWSSTSRHTPVTAPAPAPDDEVTRLRLEIARLQVALAAQTEYRTLLITSLERERAIVDADRQSALAREAQHAEREARIADAAAARDVRHAEELAQLRNELAQLRNEGAKREEDARDREAWWRAANAKWDAERAEFKVELERREEQLARRDREQDEQMQVQAGLRQQIAMIQARMSASMRAGSSAMVLSLRKRPHMYLGEDSEDEGSSEDIQDAPVTRSRRVKRRSASPDALPTLAFAYTEREHKFKPKPPWYHVEELTFHTAETRPNHTAASVVAFIKTNAVSIEYHKTKGRTAVFRKKYLTLRLPDGRSAIVSADYYRLPTLFLSHFLWAYVWRVITRGEAFEKEMFNLLHLARLLRALVEGAIRAAPQYNLAEGQDICTWRFLPFDRALIRMSYDDFLLPIDGYGDRYNDEFWKRNQDTKYRPRQDIEHRNWKKIVTSRNEWLAPLEDEELQSFDAAAFAECLRIRDGVPIWVPTSEAGRAATERLKAKYSDVRSEAAQSTLQATAEASAGVVVQGIVTTDLERPEPVSSPSPSPGSSAHPAQTSICILSIQRRSSEGVASIDFDRRSSSFNAARSSGRVSRRSSLCTCEHIIASHFCDYNFFISSSDTTSNVLVSLLSSADPGGKSSV